MYFPRSSAIGFVAVAQKCVEACLSCGSCNAKVCVCVFSKNTMLGIVKMLQKMVCTVLGKIVCMKWVNIGTLICRRCCLLVSGTHVCRVVAKK